LQRGCANFSLFPQGLKFLRQYVINARLAKVLVKQNRVLQHVINSTVYFGWWLKYQLNTEVENNLSN